MVLCGLDASKVHMRVMGMTYITKLTQKYHAQPENFFNSENLRLESSVIKLFSSTGKADYLGGTWNNFDDYCL